MYNTKTYILSLVFIILTIGLYAQPQFSIEKVSFNTNDYGEFSPGYYKNGIVFCSDHKNDVIISYSDTSEYSLRMNHLYFSTQKENKKWTSPVHFAKELETLFNEGPFSFYNDSNSLVFTRNIDVNKKFGNYLKPNNQVGLFFATYNNNKWENITPFIFNSKSYSIMHPSITNDGKTLYFSSNMPGGYGGFDLYVCKFKNGSWSQPKNLGPNVNSDQDEAFPFIHSSGRLFFASRGWKSKGGFDIFFTQEFGDKWIKPQNMKEPFNSTSDDFGLIADPYVESGYFSSNRAKSDDIYYFKSLIADFETCKQQQQNNFCYVFFESGTSDADVKGTMKYEWDLGDGTKIRALEAEHCFAKPGEYLIKLNVIDSITNEIYYSQAQYNFVVEEIEQPIITAPDEITEGQPVTFDAKKSNLKFRVAKYYWDFGDGLKGIGNEVSHVFYQEGVYDVKVNVESTQGKNGVRKMCVYKPIIVKAP